MSDGGGESERENSGNCASKKSSPPDDFGRALSRIAAAQICESAGFHSVRRSALDALADITIRYICDLGKTAHFYAGLSGRTDCNVFDVIQGLEDVGSSHGFNAAADIHRCLVRSGVVREITQYTSSAEEVPFAHPVPKFLIARSLKPTPSFGQIGEVPAGKHIPEWLPAFPDRHTYVHTPVWNERACDPREDKIEQVRQRRRAERSLLSLQQRLACNDTTRFVPAIEGDTGKGKQVVCTSNPFLTPPLPYGEKDVSEIVIPNEVAIGKRMPVLETFAPAIEVAKAAPLDSGINEIRILPNRRTRLHFRFGIDKKSVAVPLLSGVLGGKTDSWFLRDDEKDDKKRRAEMILKEAMENPEELTQLFFHMRHLRFITIDALINSWNILPPLLTAGGLLGVEASRFQSGVRRTKSASGDVWPVHNVRNNRSDSCVLNSRHVVVVYSFCDQVALMSRMKSSLKGAGAQVQSSCIL